MPDNEVIELSKQHFRSFARQMKTVSLDNVYIFKTGTRVAMRRLHLKHDPSKAVKGIPRGSDQFSPRSFILWTEKIKKTDAKAVKHLIAFHATITARLGG